MGKNLQTTDGFSSKIGIIAATAGSAIGLGNIWKFPYVTGVHGGGAFLILYLICVVLIGLPIMLAEFTIGRRHQRNAVRSFKTIAPGTPWFLTGWLGIIAAFVILSFYGVVAGWTLDYVFKALTGTLSNKTPEEFSAMFGSLVSGTYRPIIWQVVFMFLTALIILGGVKDGIEKYAKILMPLLLLIIIILDIRAITLPGASAGLKFLFSPDFSKLTGGSILAALGQAFFSLSLGMGAIITYGSYVSKKENLTTTAIHVTIADTAIALLAGLAIFPAVFAFGLKPGAGPGLVFITLPNIFQQMFGGSIFSILFFLLLTVAALTSSISLLEVVVAYFTQDLKISRKKATIYITVAMTALGALASLTNGPLSGFKLPFLTKGTFVFFDWLIELSDAMLPLGGLFIALFLGWAMKRSDIKEELSSKGRYYVGYLPALLGICKIVAPIVIAIIFLNTLGLF